MTQQPGKSCGLYSNFLRILRVLEAHNEYKCQLYRLMRILQVFFGSCRNRDFSPKETLDGLCRFIIQSKIFLLSQFQCHWLSLNYEGNIIVAWFAFSLAARRSFFAVIVALVFTDAVNDKAGLKLLVSQIITIKRVTGDGIEVSWHKVCERVGKLAVCEVITLDCKSGPGGTKLSDAPYICCGNSSKRGHKRM